MKIKVDEKFLEWYDSQPKDKDGIVTIKHGTGHGFPISLLGLDSEKLKSVPNIKIGAKLTPTMLDGLKK